MGHVLLVNRVVVGIDMHSIDGEILERQLSRRLRAQEHGYSKLMALLERK
jgi:uncharacterized membrane protein YjjP (DUF1212 family)